MLVDYHMHFNTSPDAVGTLKEHCEAAVKAGISEICFTNHQEWWVVNRGKFTFAMDDKGWKNLFMEVEQARKDFPQLTIRLGCELGYFPEHIEEIKEFTKRYPFDYIIGSIHRINGILLSEHGDEQGTPREIFKRYFELMGKMVENPYFDCLGHIDAIARYYRKAPEEGYLDLIPPIIESLKKNDLGFEINTGGWSYPSGECNPSKEILKMLFEAGIKKVTIGSDSHTTEEVGRSLKRGMDLLKEIGFTKFCTFEKRKAIFNPL